MREYFGEDELLCLICNEDLHALTSLVSLDVEERCICINCQKQFQLHKGIYKIKGKEWHVLFEYNEFLERLFFRYKEQKDIVLAKAFLWPVKMKPLNKVNLCALCSSEKKRFERGFEPILEIYEKREIYVYSPLYKAKDHKQSKQNRQGRKEIQSILKRKQLYEIPKDERVFLVDDVCTTGASMERALELVESQGVFVLAAHPKWIEEHAKDRVEKKGFFW